MLPPAQTPAAEESRARHMAKSIGLRLSKSHQSISAENLGGFRIVDDRYIVIAGEKFDMSARDVITFCTEYPENRGARDSMGRT